MASDDSSLDYAKGWNGTFGDVRPVLEKYETAVLLLVGFGGASLILAVLHKSVRRHVFHDADNVDTAFDAGGQVSTSLTAVTVASQLLWPGDLLQGSTITVKSGISGPFWYTVGAALNIALFPILSVHLKTRAPGAKTFLQIIHARFGKPAHLFFCFLALLVNALAIATLLVAGVAIIQSLTNDASDEFCVLIIATLFGSYSLVGGLGTTFYVSYFNAVLIFSALTVLIIKILHTSDGANDAVGSLEILYNRLKTLRGPDGNAENSFLTFRSENGWVFAVMGLCLTSSLTYCDQASWQSRIAAKPLQGVLGFLAATYVWFAIPSSIAATTGLAYLAMSADNTSTIMTMTQVNEGMVTPFIAQELMGKAGGILVLTMIAMALMSTGSGEVMAVSSIVVYDIYQIYINPFKKNIHHRACLLCGKSKGQDEADPSEDHVEPYVCTCPHPASCVECKGLNEIKMENGKNKALQHIKKYSCQYHGDYRFYQEQLLTYKSWCILWVTVAQIPFGIAIKASGVDLNWVMLFGFIVTIPCFPAVALSIFSSKTTGKGVIAGAATGMVGGVSSALGVASTYEGGLGLFLENTVQNYSILAGAGASLGLSFFVTLIVSLCTTKVKVAEDAEREWNILRNIDNPLHPWCDIYKEDFPHLKEAEKPSVEDLNAIFNKARIVAYIGGCGTLILFVVIIPSVMLSLHVLSLSQFKAWMYVLQTLFFAMATIVIVVAPLEEVFQIYKQVKRNRAPKNYVNSNNAIDMETAVTKSSTH